jgi:biotin carboxyl carrier protein
MSALRLRQGDSIQAVRIERDAADLGGRSVAFERVERDGRLVGIRIGGQEHPVVTASDGSRVFVWCDGTVWAFERSSAARAAGPRYSEGDLISPMPGRVRRILVAEGQSVARGDVLLVLEAMKMEHAIRAPKDGAVRLRVAEGDLVDAGVELAIVE